MKRMVDVFLLFSFGSHAKDIPEAGRLTTSNSSIFGATGRLTSTKVNIQYQSCTTLQISVFFKLFPFFRDLLKWCAWRVAGYDVTSVESAHNVIQNGIDIFCCNVSDEGKLYD